MAVVSPLDGIADKYDILDRIKVGGMGAVYKVRHRLLDELRVIKILRPHLEGDEDEEQRFLREARLASRLRHPNIAQFYDFTVDDEGYALIIMEFVPGLDLAELLTRTGAPDLALTLEVARQALTAVGYLHRRRMVHRDISPDNFILARSDDDTPLVKMIDLGIVKARGQDTTERDFVGKLPYAAPERFSRIGEANLDERSDLYSFGVVLYELATGRLPFSGNDPAALIAAHLGEAPLGFEVSDPESRVPKELRQVILRALEKRAWDRFESAEAFSEALLPIQKILPLGPGTMAGVQRCLDERAGLTDEARAQAAAVATIRVPMSEMPGQPADDAQTPDYESLITAVKRLMKKGQLDKADEQLSALRTIQPDSPRAEELAVLIGEAREQNRERVIEETRVTVIKLLDQDDAVEAAAALKQAEEMLGPEERLAELKSEVEPLADQEREQAAGELLKEARSHLRLERFVEALGALEKAIELSPHQKVAQDLLSKTRSAYDQYRSLHDPGEAVTRLVAVIAICLDAGKLDEAGKRLKLAIDRYGDSERLRDLAGRLADLHRRRARADEEMVKATAFIREARIGPAIDVLRKALLIDPRNDVVAALLAISERAAEKETAFARELEEIPLAAAEIEGLIDNAEIEMASRLLTVAIKKFGEREILVDLRRRFREQQKRENRVFIESHIAAARRAVGEGDLRQALSELRQAAALAPGDHEVSALLETTVRDHAVATIRQYISSGELAEAGRALSIAKKLHAGDSRLAELQTELDEVKIARSDLAVAGLLKSSRAYLDSGDFAAALQELRRAGLVEPGNADIRTLTQEVMRRHAEVTIADYLDRNEVAEALRALHVAERMYGLSDQLAGLRRRLKATERRQSGAAVDALMNSARRMIEDSDDRAAVEALRHAGELDPGNPELGSLTQEALCRQAFEAIEDHLELGSFADARKAIELTEKLFGDSAALRLLRERLEDLEG